jgi:hypothetical protein
VRVSEGEGESRASKKYRMDGVQAVGGVGIGLG